MRVRALGKPETLNPTEFECFRTLGPGFGWFQPIVLIFSVFFFTLRLQIVREKQTSEMVQCCHSVYLGAATASKPFMMNPRIQH